MQKKAVPLLILFLFYFGLYSTAQNIYLCDDGKISFNSNAPLELIQAESNKMLGAVDLNQRTFAFKVKITSFKGFNGELQRDHFNENYMESEKFPEATFTGKIIEDIDFTKQKTLTVRAKGTLTIHGVEQERIINVTVEESGNSISCKAKFSVLLSEHNITVPKVVHEKIASEVTVDVNAVLQKRKE